MNINILITIYDNNDKSTDLINLYKSSYENDKISIDYDFLNSDSFDYKTYNNYLKKLDKFYNFYIRTSFKSIIIINKLINFLSSNYNEFSNDLLIYAFNGHCENFIFPSSGLYIYNRNFYNLLMDINYDVNSDIDFNLCDDLFLGKLCKLKNINIIHINRKEINNSHDISNAIRSNDFHYIIFNNNYSSISILSKILYNHSNKVNNSNNKMKLDCVLSSCNLNETYLNFLPTMIKAWNIALPFVDVKVIVIIDNNDEKIMVSNKFNEYIDNIIFYYRKNKTISTAFISQYIRLLYPSLLTNYKGGILTTDIDIIPINPNYFNNTKITNCTDDCFIYYRDDCLYMNQIAICYNIATPIIWSEIFDINSLNNIDNKLFEVYSNLTLYDENNKSIQNDWATDQKHLYDKVMEWNNYKSNNKFIYFKDSEMNYNRLCRDKFSFLTNDIKTNIINKNYSDYHMLRPYDQFKHINDEIINLLSNNKINNNDNNIKHDLIQHISNNDNDDNNDDCEINKAISFCIYGNNKKYCQGLLDNIININNNNFLKNFTIYIYAGSDVPSEYINKYKQFSNVKYITVDCSRSILKCYRYLPISDVNNNINVCFVRDVDSRMTDRDVWCIKQFLKSNNLFHTIRDHYYHKTYIMEGLFAFRNVKEMVETCSIDILNEWISRNRDKMDKYDVDSDFLKEMIYPIIKKKYLDKFMIHSNLVGYHNEKIYSIIDMNDEFDFVGNVYEYDQQKYTFKYNNNPNIDLLLFLDKEQRYDIIINLADKINLNEYPLSHEKYDILNHLIAGTTKYIHNLHNFIINSNNNTTLKDEVVKCINIVLKLFSYFKYTFITDTIIDKCNVILKLLLNYVGYNIIATTDINRIPDTSKKEIIICYGSMHHSVECVDISNGKLIRHPIYFNNDLHNVIEFEMCWKNINQLYIINLVERKDRYTQLLVELCRIGFPLNLITHVKGYKNNETNDKRLNSYIGATGSHIEALEDAVKNNYENIMILEDDFIFSLNYNKIKNDIKTFFDRKYDFDVLFVSASKQHQINEFDDLLMISKQECTTTSGYIVGNKSLQKILNVMKEGLNELKNNRNYNGVCDRYWTKLNVDNKFFIFKNKFGYQQITSSDIVNCINWNFD